MNDVYVQVSNVQNFNQDGKESAILKNKDYSPPKSKFQHLLVKEKVKNIEVNSMRKSYFIDILTVVDIQRTVKLGGKSIKFLEGNLF